MNEGLEKHQYKPQLARVLENAAKLHRAHHTL
jgi:hypothetical protein